MSSQGTSERAFEEYCRSRWSHLVRTVYLMTGDRALSEDLAQDALACVFARVRRGHTVESLDAYVHRTLMNAAHTQLKRRSRESSRAELPEGSTEPYKDAALRLDVQDALLALPPRTRQVVVLRYFRQLSVRETAQALGCAEGTVKSHTFDGLKRLKPLLGEGLEHHV